VKISKATLDILKSYAAINSNLLIKAGSKISTMSASKDIMAECDVEEKFTTEAGIFNMSEFLGVVSLYEAPDFDFDSKFVTISEGKQKVKYVYADAALLTVPTKTITMPKAEIEFSLSAGQLQKIQKASAALAVGDLAIVGDGKTIECQVLDAKNPSSNSYSIDLEATTTEKFAVYFKVEKLKLIPGDYDVEISSKKISKFTSKNIKLVVYVACEANSTFG
jgi:hypothetical protein